MFINKLALSVWLMKSESFKRKLKFVKALSVRKDA